MEPRTASQRPQPSGVERRLLRAQVVPPVPTHRRRRTRFCGKLRRALLRHLVRHSALCHIILASLCKGALCGGAQVLWRLHP